MINWSFPVSVGARKLWLVFVCVCVFVCFFSWAGRCYSEACLPGVRKTLPKFYGVCVCVWVGLRCEWFDVKWLCGVWYTGFCFMIGFLCPTVRHYADTNRPHTAWSVCGGGGWERNTQTERQRKTNGERHRQAHKHTETGENQRESGSKRKRGKRREKERHTERKTELVCLLVSALIPVSHKDRRTNTQRLWKPARERVRERWKRREKKRQKDRKTNSEKQTQTDRQTHRYR